MPWTPKLIHRLKRYVDADRLYRVHYRCERVYGIDIPPDEYPIEQAAVYMQEYDDCPPDNFSVIGDMQPEDFSVYRLALIEWQEEV
jgi:hypothetical protein